MDVLRDLRVVAGEGGPCPLEVPVTYCLQRATAAQVRCRTALELDPDPSIEQVDDLLVQFLADSLEDWQIADGEGHLIGANEMRLREDIPKAFIVDLCNAIHRDYEECIALAQAGDRKLASAIREGLQAAEKE